MVVADVLELEIEFLQPNPLQPRGLITPDSLVELVDSIREHGILEPLLVAKTPAGYQIVAGERRWRASKIAGLKKVPVRVRETSPSGMLEMALVENIQREDLSALERALAFKKLVDDFNYANNEIAIKVGKSHSYVSNTLRLLNLPDALKDALASGATSEGHARALAGLDDPGLIVEAYKEVLAKTLSVRGAEDLVRKIKQREQIPPKTARDQGYIRNSEIEAMEERWRQRILELGGKSTVKIMQSRVQVKIQINVNASQETTSSILNTLDKNITT